MSQHGINHKAYIGLGSNMANPVAQVRGALDELAHLPSSRLLAVSSLYRSAPVGKLDQPDFINAVALIETDLTRKTCSNPCLKLSIITGGCANTATVPGPSISTSSYMTTCNTTTPTSPCRTRACINARLFLQPLCEIAPDCRLAGHGTLAELLKECAGQQFERALE